MHVFPTNPISLKNLGAATILAAGIVVAGATNAATIVQSQMFQFGRAEVNVTVAAGATDSDSNQETISFGSLSRFNTGIGTLNSVSFNVAWTGEVEHIWHQLVPSSSFSVTHLSTVTFRADGSNDSVAANAGVTQNIVNPTSAAEVVVTDIAGGGTFTETSAAFLALFSGPGSIASSIELENFVELTVTSGGPVNAFGYSCAFDWIACTVASGNPNPIVMGSLEITYDYTEASVAMSAPGGIALIALGLVGMGTGRRRR